MALNSAGKLANVHAALDAYLATLGYSVHRHGERRFVPPTSDPWLRAHYDLLGIQRHPYRQVSDTEVGEELIGTLNLVIAQHARIFTARYTLAATRDVVVAAFPPGGLIPIYDEEDTTTRPQVGTLYIDTVREHFLDDGMFSGLVQHAFEIMLRYLEATTSPLI